MFRTQDPEREVCDSRHSAISQHHSPNREWEQMVLDLRVGSDAASDTFSGLDEIVVARYLAGDCSDEERRYIERAIAQSSDLAEFISVAQEALRNAQAAA